MPKTPGDILYILERLESLLFYSNRNNTGNRIKRQITRKLPVNSTDHMIRLKHELSLRISAKSHSLIFLSFDELLTIVSAVDSVFKVKEVAWSLFFDDKVVTETVLNCFEILKIAVAAVHQNQNSLTLPVADQVFTGEVVKLEFSRKVTPTIR